MKKFDLACIESRIDTPRNVYAHLKIGPFEKNHTLTIANNLRRSLLSELRGVAIIAVKIQGVKHEYSSLVGVRESVLDILLNIKEIVLSSAFQIHSPHLAYLSVKGKQVVKAGDIQFPAFFKCVDPDQHIATLSHDGKLTIAFLIYPGKNYWMQLGSTQFVKHCNTIFSQANLKSQERFIGIEQMFQKSTILPIDAIFMPINRVNYTIEVDDEIDTEKPYEHIFLEIWTNGSIHPITAVEQAAQSLVQLFTPFQTIQSFQIQPRFLTLKPSGEADIEMPMEIGMDDSSKRGVFSLDLDSKDPVLIRDKKDGELLAVSREVEDGLNLSSLLESDLANLNLSLRPYTCLKRANIQNVRQLLTFSGEELLQFKNFGKRSLEEVENSLYKMGFFSQKSKKIILTE